MNWVDILSVVYLILFVATMLLTNVLDLAAQSTMLALLLLLLALPIFLPALLLLRVTLLSGSFYGALWVMRISDLLAREYRNGTYDLLALLPSGEITANWAVATGSLYRNHALPDALDLRLMVLRAIIFVEVLFMGSALLGWSAFTLLGAQTLALLAALYVDFIHSTVLAVLIGMIVPIFTRTDVRLWAAGSFVSLQIITYSVTIIVAAVIPPPIIGELAGHVMTLIVTLIVFCGGREIIIAGLWRWLLRLSNSGEDELDSIFTWR